MALSVLQSYVPRKRITGSRARGGFPGAGHARLTAVTETPSLEERVAALEEAIRFPLRAYIPSWTPLTEAEEAEVSESIAEAARMPPRVIQPPPPLSRDEIRQILRECVTVIKPGEHLILRVPWTTTPGQLRELQADVNEAARWLELPFKTLILPGDELAVAEPGETPGAA